MRFFAIFLFMGFVSMSIAEDKGKDKTLLFSIENHDFFEEDVKGMLYSGKEKHEITQEEFNSVLNFYLTIYDIKKRGEDTTKLFKRNLEQHKIRMLGDVYGSENHSKIIEKCSVGRDSFAVVEDLFVPFEPGLLRMLENLRKQDTPFKEIVSYAMGQEGVTLRKRIIVPTESPMSLRLAACELFDKNEQIVGPLKDLKGYHYLKYIRTQENFGEYKVQLIFIGNNRDENQALEKVKALKKALSEKKAFDDLVSLFSEDRSLFKTKGITYFSPKIDLDSIFKSQLLKLTYDGQISPLFSTHNGWYVLKRLSKKDFPTEDDLRKFALSNTRLASFFMEDLKEEYGLIEYPYHFMSGRSQILFLVDRTPYYTEDLDNYAKEYGYDITTETYDKFLNHLLLERYVKSLDKERYQRLLDDYYFFQLKERNILKQQDKIAHIMMKNLKDLVKKYKLVIPNKRYVENNWIFSKK